jgi:riboflavin transporter FmnP
LLERVGVLSQLYFRRQSVFIAGTALLGALVFVLDWSFKLAGLKIPFPLLTFLKFDLLGIPILVSYFLFGFYSGTTTSIIAMISIAFRDPFSGFMKFLAEFTTIVGVFVVLRGKRSPNNWWKTTAMGMGILMRVTVMNIANVLLLPIFVSGQTFAAVIALLPLLSIFNGLQGAISIFGGFLLYEAIALRLHNEKNP